MRTLTITLAVGGIAYAIAFHSWQSLVVGGVLFAPMMFATLRPNVEWLGPVMSRFPAQRNEVWLTIDDGPTDDTGALLDLLDRLGVRATFFVKGILAAQHPERIQAILARGHTVGNHSHTHPSATFWCLPPHAIAREIDRCSAVIPPTKLFRAPVGFKNPFVHPLLRRRGMKLIGFHARAFDAVERNPDVIAARIVKSLVPGAIIVLHQGREWSLRGIEKTVAAARERGYDFVIPS
jgi:peptidoglycan/xylan/chitin deacetylase (PgdA/CDA1 family)